MKRTPSKRKPHPVHPVRGALSRANPSVRPYFGLTRLRWEFAARLTGALAVGLLASTFFLWAVRQSSLPHIITIFLVPTLLVVALDRLIERCARLAEIRTRELDRQEVGAVHEDALHVGVAYADGFWSIQSSYSWDRGWLSISPNGLAFNGCASGFSLPSHSVRTIRLVRSAHESSASLRVFIDWLDPDGETNTLSLEPLIVGDRKAKLTATESLLVGLQTTFSQLAEHPLSPAWPPAVSPERLRANDLRLGKKEILWLVTRSVGTTLGVCGVLYLALTVFAIDPGLRRIAVSGAFNFVLSGSFILFFLIQYRRWQTTPPPPVTPLPDLAGQDEPHQS